MTLVQFILYLIFLNINNLSFFLSIIQIISFNNKIPVVFGLIFEKNRDFYWKQLLFVEY